MKKLKVSLLTKVVIAIAAGVLFGQFLPNGIARIFVTFNSLFGNFLSFSTPPPYHPGAGNACYRRFRERCRKTTGHYGFDSLRLDYIFRLLYLFQ